jgi:hypothetical protein
MTKLFQVTFGTRFIKCSDTETNVDEVFAAANTLIDWSNHTVEGLMIKALYQTSRLKINLEMMKLLQILMILRLVDWCRIQSTAAMPIGQSKLNTVRIQLHLKQNRQTLMLSKFCWFRLLSINKLKSTDIQVIQLLNSLMKISNLLWVL